MRYLTLWGSNCRRARKGEREIRVEEKERGEREQTGDSVRNLGKIAFVVDLLTIGLQTLNELLDYWLFHLAGFYPIGSHFGRRFRFL